VTGVAQRERERETEVRVPLRRCERFPSRSRSARVSVPVAIVSCYELSLENTKKAKINKAIPVTGRGGSQGYGIPVVVNHLCSRTPPDAISLQLCTPKVVGV
jgi:hypothetical protein